MCLRLFDTSLEPGGGMSGLHKPLGSKVAGWGEAVAEGKQERSAGASLRKDYNKKENLSIFGCRLSFGFAIHTFAFTLLMSLPPLTATHSPIILLGFSSQLAPLSLSPLIHQSLPSYHNSLCISPPAVELCIFPIL